MRKIFLFMMISLDGFFEGTNHDITWHNVDNEFNEFAIEQLDTIDLILFGRLTYQLMESFWPTEQGLKGEPETAKRMNSIEKIVFSKTLGKVNETKHWKNIRLIKNNISEEVDKIKKHPGKDIAIFGSSNLCITLLKLNLVDELRIMINPVIIGKGTSLFEGFDRKLNLKLFKTRKFGNGNILLYYNLPSSIR